MSKAADSPRAALLWGIALALMLCASGRAADAKKPDAPATPERSPRIAVVDMSRVYRSYSKADEFQKKLNEMGKMFSEKEAGLNTRIVQVGNERASLSMGNPRRQELQDELDKKQNELAVLRADADRQLDETLRAGTLEVYEDTVKAVTEYAKAHEIDIVLKQQTFNPDQPSARDQSIRIGQRDVLYCASEFDITDAITDALNKSYQQKVEAKINAIPK